MSDESLRALERAADESPDDGDVLDRLDRAQARAGHRRITTALRERLAIALRVDLEHRLRAVYAETYAHARAILEWPRRRIDQSTLEPDVRAAWARLVESNTVAYFFAQPALDVLRAAGINLELMDAGDAVAETIKGASSDPDNDVLCAAVGRMAGRIVRLALVGTRETDSRGREAFEELTRLVGFEPALVLAGIRTIPPRGVLRIDVRPAGEPISPWRALRERIENGTLVLPAWRPDPRDWDDPPPGARDVADAVAAAAAHVIGRPRHGTPPMPEESAP